MDQKIFSTICYALFKDTSKQCFLPELLSLLYIEFNCYTQAIVFHCLCISVSLEASSSPTSHLLYGGDIEFNCYTQAIVFHCLCVSVSLEVSSTHTSHLLYGGDIEFNCYTQAIVFHCLCISVSLEVSSTHTSHLSASSPRKAKSLELVRQ